MWSLDHPWWEYILRAVVIYTTVFFLLRVVGKKQIGELGPFDLVLLLIISEAVSNALTGGDDSLTAGLISVTSFVVMNYLIDFLTFKSKKVEKVLDGEPLMIIKEGKINEQVRRQEKITYDEISSVLREHGISKLSDVKFAMVETNGQISIIENEEEPKKKSSAQNETNQPV
jgi:uncharacterized membrane protein YcaP (DUF421 family)